MKKYVYNVFSIIIIPILMAACRPAEPSVSRPPPNASQAASAVPVSSQPVSSAPVPSAEPISSGTVSQAPLNLVFDERVYVDVFNFDGYFNNKNEWIWWDINPGAHLPNPAYTFSGKYRNFYCDRSYPQNYKNFLASLTDARQASFLLAGGDLFAVLPYVLNENGSVVFPSGASESAQEKQYREHLLAWRDVVYIVSVFDVVGLKKDGTLVFEPYPFNREINEFAQNFDPNSFRDIVMIMGSNGEADQKLLLLQKDGTLINWKKQILYKNVIRVFPANYQTDSHFVLLADGTLIGLQNGQSYGILENPEEIVSVQGFAAGVYALKKDGSFDTIWSNPSDWENRERQRLISQVTDCKTT